MPGIHHLCFKAKSRNDVGNFYEFLLENKVKIYDKPEAYPRYADKYYAMFFADPDRIKLELAYS